MELERKHVTALDKAESLIFHSDFCPYLELKEMLPDTTALARERFCVLFTNFYGLNVAGLSDDFQKRFFEILFSGEGIINGQPDFLTIFTKLSEFKRRKGDSAMQFSFVSKLANIHCERSPIYDRHVLAFFGERPSDPKVNMAERIECFTQLLGQVARSYHTWANDERIKPILQKLKSRDTRLGICHEVRLIDFLVWKVGKEKLLVISRPPYGQRN